MSQAKRTIKTNDDNETINKLLDHIEEKYQIPRDVYIKTIDTSKIAFKLENYSIKFQGIDDEIEAIIFNRHIEVVTTEVINTAINNLIETSEKEREAKNKTNKKNTNKQNILSQNNQISSNKINPAKKTNVKYNTNIVYNLGENEMESKFTEVNPELNKDLLTTIDAYDLLPKDCYGQRDGYEKYFSDIKDKLLDELKIKDDPLLEKNKFVLFLAFDVIDAKPTFDDLIGIDPLNDYKKYILKINIKNNNNLFFVSGQILFIEGDLVDDGKVIEVTHFRNIYEINEYNLNYEDISYLYKDSDPYAIYYMNGPYFSKDNIDFSVFNNVIEKVVYKNPHYFIINGPLFSTENEKVKFGEFNTEDGMLDIIKYLKEKFINTRTKILICPGISDNENFYPLPQPPFDKVNEAFLDSNKESKIIFISNPQIFTLNEAYIGVANFDAIKDIIFNSIHSPEINTVDKACEMILYQKNFYPILPNTLPQTSDNNQINQERIVTVDLSQYKYMNFDKCESPPDIILTNSVMKTFAKKIHGTVFVNCGSFLKGKNYGESAKITLHSPSQEITDINKRLKVEFIKINANLDTNNNKK